MRRLKAGTSLIPFHGRHRSSRKFWNEDEHRGEPLCYPPNTYTFCQRSSYVEKTCTLSSWQALVRICVIRVIFGPPLHITQCLLILCILSPLSPWFPETACTTLHQMLTPASACHHHHGTTQQPVLSEFHALAGDAVAADWLHPRPQRHHHHYTWWEEGSGERRYVILTSFFLSLRLFELRCSLSGEIKPEKLDRKLVSCYWHQIGSDIRSCCC